MAVKIHFVSDLHLDFLDPKISTDKHYLEHFAQMLKNKNSSHWMNMHESAKVFNEKGKQIDKEVLLILGDLAEERHFKNYIPILEEAVKEYDAIYYIMGNHEHFHSNFPRTFIKIQELINKSKILKDKFFLVENDVVKIRDDLQIIFCTYWYTVSPVDEYDVSQRLREYKTIRTPKYHRIKYLDFAAENQKSIEFIEKTLKETPKGVQTILATHHATSHYCHKGTQYEFYPKEWLGFSSVIPPSIGYLLEEKPVVACLHGHAHHDDYDSYINEWGIPTYMNTIGYAFDEYVITKPRNIAHLLL